MVLHEILQKWKAASAPPGSLPVSEVKPESPDIEETVIMASSKNELGDSTDKGLSTAANLKTTDIPVTPAVDTDWDADMQETVIFSSSDSAPPSESTPREVPDPQRQESQWNDDIEETVVLRTDSITPSPRAASPADDMDQTVVISAPSSAGPDEDLEATIVLKKGGSPAPQPEAPTVDDDLSATMVQGPGERRPVPSPRPGISDWPSSDRSATMDDLDATVVIRPSGQQPPSTHSAEISARPADDDLAATRVETPRSGLPPGAERPMTPPATPQPLPVAPESEPREGSQRVPPVQANDDDDIMEQTIIIRSDVKKE